MSNPESDYWLSVDEPASSAHARRLMFAAALVLMAAAFMLDLYTPRGVADWQSHLLIVLITLAVPGRWHVLATATACTALIIAGFFGNPDTMIPLWVSMFNRVLGIADLWVIAIGGLFVRRVVGLRAANARLRREIAERERLEAQVLRTQRLESVGVLAGGLAHDFNNLLTPMLMAVKLLRENRPADERDHLLDALQAGAERGADVVRKLLSFAGGGDACRVPVAVPAAVAEVAGIVTHVFPPSVRLDVQVPEHLRPVIADPTQFVQVLMNLCVNARDAMPTGGTLTVSADELTIGLDEFRTVPNAAPGDYIRVTVADTGTGIPGGIIDRIFDPFFTTKPPGQGTGLGLSAVLGIVRGHGGFVTVESSPGAGARFEIFWPAGDAGASVRSTPDAEPVPTGAGELILVVDDEAAILLTTRTALEAEGYRVITACDGGDAVTVYREHGPDIRAVILDVMMPGVDGGTTLATLRSIAPGCRVLLTSGVPPTGSLAAAVRDGRVGFIRKPYPTDRLLAALGRVIADRTPATAATGDA